jgi:hypothetical protein
VEATEAEERQQWLADWRKRSDANATTNYDNYDYGDDWESGEEWRKLLRKGTEERDLGRGGWRHGLEPQRPASHRMRPTTHALPQHYHARFCHTSSHILTSAQLCNPPIKHSTVLTTPNYIGPGRCFPFWQEVLACYVTNTSAEDNSGASKCQPVLEDYYECLHHKKEVRYHPTPSSLHTTHIPCLAPPARLHETQHLSMH